LPKTSRTRAPHPVSQPSLRHSQSLACSDCSPHFGCCTKVPTSRSAPGRHATTTPYKTRISEALHSAHNWREVVFYCWWIFSIIALVAYDLYNCTVDLKWIMASGNCLPASGCCSESFIPLSRSALLLYISFMCFGVGVGPRSFHVFSPCGIRSIHTY
jgi:hypothetical protein